MNKVRIGIIGFGTMGSKHGKYLTEDGVSNAVLTAVADIDPARLELAKSMSESINTFDKAEDLIESGECDAIIIAAPHYFHPVYAIKGFQAGLHVLVEKPAGVYTKQAEEMNAEASKSGKVFGIMYNQRTNPLYQKVREMIKSDQLGEIIRTNWIITSWYRSQSYYDQGGWRATWAGEGGGVLLNQNPHNLDLWQWICGMPKRVKSEIYYGKHRDIEVEDDVYALVEYENGATGSYITTIADTPGTNRLEITGQKGKVVIENGKIEFWELSESEPEFNKRYKDGIGQPKNTKIEIPVEGKTTGHVGITQNFCDAILTGEPLLAPGVEGINGLQISNAMHLSSWTGGGWVDIPVDGDLFYKLLKEKSGGKI
ncbi:MAG TPA: Gfo/Idh/MocA family oxidoreductase [Thermoclostridium sp.]|nr:Gfo/Idh/MocA family oxidoreductase [Thermoclostridium sp.]